MYVHAPFCARRCVYCDFAVKVQAEGGVEEWAEAIVGEVRAVEEEGLFRLATRLDTVYVGGGTPSLLGATAMDYVRDILGLDTRSAPDMEWTAEANPESLTPETAEGWRVAGVNRISLGVQTFDPDALRWMGRLHGPDGAVRAVDTARDAGIDELSVDLIFALPEGVRRSWEDDLDRALDLGAPHVSLYGLTVESGTRLARSVAEGREDPADEERYRAEYLKAVERMTSAGYHHYEVSNFALPGHESRHNSAYWSGDPYLGLGNGAHSYAPPVRRWNVREWDDYRALATEGRSPEAEREVVEGDAQLLEMIWLGLRSARGLALDRLPEQGLEVVEAWTKQGLGSVEEGSAVLTTEGWLLLDRLAVELAAATTG